MKCDELNVIPQFTGSCWFNAILMATLYSQNARKVLLKTSKTWDKKDKLFKIFKLILKKNYKNKSINEFFNINKPELILYKMIRKFNPELKNFFKKSLKNRITAFGFDTEYITKYLKFLNVNCLDILYTSTNDIYLNIDSIHKFSRNNDKFTYTADIGEVISKKDYLYINEIKDIIKKIPDIIILSHYKLFKINSTLKQYSINYLKTLKYDHVFNAKTYADDFIINVDDVKNYKDKIVINGHTYVLDSCIINNYGERANAHAIAGITCNNNKYVYNGWSRTTFDPAFKNEKKENALNSPCSLMKFNWNFKKNLPFCLNTKLCKLDTYIPKDELCFSFSKGERLLIYVRSDLKTDTITTTSSINNNSQDIKDFIDELFDIPNMNKTDIITNLINYFDFYEYQLKIYQSINYKNYYMINYLNFIEPNN
jgi:hypothetical protein